MSSTIWFMINLIFSQYIHQGNFAQRTCLGGGIWSWTGGIWSWTAKYLLDDRLPHGKIRFVSERVFQATLMIENVRIWSQERCQNVCVIDVRFFFVTTYQYVPICQCCVCHWCLQSFQIGVWLADSCHVYLTSSFVWRWETVKMYSFTGWMKKKLIFGCESFTC